MKLWVPALLLSLSLGLAAGAQETTLPEAAAPAETAPDVVPVLPEAPAQPAAPEAAAPEAGAPATVVTEPPAQPAAPSAEAEATVPESAVEGTVAEGAGQPAAAAPAVAPADIPASPAEALAEATAHTDLYSIVMVAHPVVQAVMALLVLAAFVALTILVQKLVEFSMATARLRRAMQVLAGARDLAPAAEALAGERGPGAAMARAATEELRLAEADPALIPGTRERSTAALTRIEAGAAMRLRAGTGLLASIGSLSPFIGLFGTVFGIMNSFLAIAETKTTSLAVVAPGIAEALLATAIGLAAAIPAVLIYNIFSRKLGAFRNRMTDLATLVLTLQSRALDRLAAAPPTPAAAPSRPARVATGG